MVPPFLRQPPDNIRTSDPKSADKPPQDKPPEQPAQPFDPAVRSGETEAVLRAFRENTLGDGERKKTLSLIAELRSDSFQARNAAEQGLAAFGPRAAAMLRNAARGAEPEQAVRLTRCLERCLAGYKEDGVISAIRLLSNRRPADAVPVLLDFAPCAPTPAAAAEVQQSLSTLGIHEGKAHDAIVKALTDAIPEKRIIAGLCLLQPAASQHRPPVRKLLVDPDVFVRAEIARALLNAGEKQAIPTLIAALAELPLAEAWPVLDRLYDLAGADGPTVAPGTDVAGRARCRDAWTAWWKTQAAKIDLAPIPATPSKPERHHLIVTVETQGQGGSVQVVTEDGRPAWQLFNLAYPVHAQILPSGRILVAEYAGNVVSERTLKEETVWKKELSKPPVAAQRLADGKTFIACRNELLVVDADGNTTFSRKFPSREITTAVARADGEFVVVTQSGAVVRLDSAGKELGRFDTGGTLVLAAGIDVTPNGRVLAPLTEKDEVVEFAPDGTALWRTSIPAPVSVQRLGNGNTLVVAMQPPQLLEVDRMGKIVWKGDVSGHPVFVRRSPQPVMRDAGPSGKAQ